jgi:hypothetical protein
MSLKFRVDSSETDYNDNFLIKLHLTEIKIFIPNQDFVSFDYVNFDFGMVDARHWCE